MSYRLTSRGHSKISKSTLLMDPTWRWIVIIYTRRLEGWRRLASDLDLKRALYRVSIITKLNIDDFALNEIELLKCSEWFALWALNHRSKSRSISFIQNEKALTLTSRSELTATISFSKLIWTSVKRHRIYDNSVDRKLVDQFLVGVSIIPLVVRLCLMTWLGMR